jgi:lipopolysaccharide transport system ATP-binding protein
MTTAISVTGLSKRYSIRHGGHRGYHTLRDEISSTVGRLLGRAASTRSSVEDFWAVENVSFEVKVGERLGIIGRNGAGKSTLLKMLSKIVEPTTGRIEIHGRLSSLLEVGTGFHPELTGRENVFLNGAILGMPRSETLRKFDEIVAFAGVERFIDTAVRHYSSGMYMRLAFAVAAHLDPDILLIDEVLAVGDLAFQQKCLGKIESITNEGRTVLFVSHNLGSISSLCTSAMLMDSGKLLAIGDVAEVTMKYYRDGSASPSAFDLSDGRRRVGNQHARLLAGKVVDRSGAASMEVHISDPVTVEMEFEVLDTHPGPFVPNFHFTASDGTVAFVSVDTSETAVGPGNYRSRCALPGGLLNEGAYFVGFGLTTFSTGVTVHFFEPGAVSFNVRDPIVGTASRGGWGGSMPGVVRPNLDWHTEKIS